MRLDHIAYRVQDREVTAGLIVQMLQYNIVDEFQPFYDCTNIYDKEIKCLVLRPTCVLEHKRMKNFFISNIVSQIIKMSKSSFTLVEHHTPPEIFISDGPPKSIVGDWVNKRNGVGGIHHLAYEVYNVKNKMKEWQELGISFTTDEPIVCPDDKLVQCFTTEISWFGNIIIELITRGSKGFCGPNIAKLMRSTKNVNSNN